MNDFRERRKGFYYVFLRILEIDRHQKSKPCERCYIDNNQCCCQKKDNNQCLKTLILLKNIM